MKPKILLVDDEMDVFSRVKEVLGKDIEVDWASDGEDCLQKLRKELPNLVLLDVRWGKEKPAGIGILRDIRESWTPSEVPVVILTGNATIEDMPELGWLNFQGWIPKRELIEGSDPSKTEQHKKMIRQVMNYPGPARQWARAHAAELQKQYADKALLITGDGVQYVWDAYPSPENIAEKLRELSIKEDNYVIEWLHQWDMEIA